jgi:hypothetical protein
LDRLQLGAAQTSLDGFRHVALDGERRRLRQQRNSPIGSGGSGTSDRARGERDQSEADSQESSESIQAREHEVGIGMTRRA